MMPDRLKLQLRNIALIGGAIRLLLLLLPKSFLVTYRLPDDALYYFQVAKNLMAGNGISFDGINPTNGFHPLWLFVISPIFAIADGWTGIYSVMVLQSLLDIGVITLIGKVAWSALDAHEQERLFAAISASLLYAFNPISIIRGINGLETTILTLVFALWLIEYLRAWKNEPRWVHLAIYAALLFLARTDSIFAAPSLLALMVLRANIISVARVLIAALIALIIVAPWLVWSKLTFGSFVQSSGEAVKLFADAKYAIEFAEGGKAAYFLSETARSWAKLFYYSTGFLGLIALFAALVRKGNARPLVPLMLPLVGILALIAYHIFARGFIRDWYVIQFIGFFSILAGITFAMMGECRRLFLFTALALMAAGWILELTTPRLSSQRVFAGEEKVWYKGGVRAAFNSGYFGYFTDGGVINLDGVVNHDILRYLREKNLGRYVDSMGITEIRDFRGTLGGYRNLFAPNLTTGFRLVDTVDAGDGEILETWRKLESP
jgi:hypothetical protein